jgi:hypothetical protein
MTMMTNLIGLVSPDEQTPQALAVAAIIIVGIAAIMTFALVRAAQYEHPTTMLVDVALLTMLCLVGLAVSTDNTAAEATFGTLAATGFGALAGAVTGRFGRKDD